MALTSASSSGQQPAQNSGNSQSASPGKQQSPPPQPVHKSAAQENPFPEDTSKQAAQQQSGQAAPVNAPDAPSAPDASNAANPPNGQTAPAPAQKPGDAAQENPFPEDVSKGAAAAASKANDTGSSSSSASSYSSSSSSNPDANGGGGDPDANPDVPATSGRRRLRKPSDKDIQSGSLAGQGRAEEDVKVGSYYLSTGDYRGAYGRFSEATRMDPTNVNAIYGLAASADGLHHHDEALNNYKLYLAIAPDGDHAKSAAKALHSLAK